MHRSTLFLLVALFLGACENTEILRKQSSPDLPGKDTESSLERDGIQKLAVIKPPFKETASSLKREELVPKLCLSGREITMGTKQLIVNPGGSLVFMNDGKKVCEIYLYVNTDKNPWLTNKERNENIPCKWHPDYVGISESVVDKEKKEFKIAGNFPLLKEQDDSGIGVEGKFTENIKLLEDGKISIKYTYDIPEKYKKNFKNTSIFVSLDKALYGNAQYLLDGIVGSDKENFQIYAPKRIEFAPENDVMQFGLSIKTVAGLSVSKAKGDFRLIPDLEKGKSIEFILDLGKCFKANEEGELVLGGVNFKKTDDLEMPDSNKCRNLLRNPSFEQGTMYYITREHFDTFLGIDSIDADASTALFGKHSLNVKLEKNAFRIIASPVPAKAGIYTVSFYAKGDKAEKQKIALEVRSGEYVVMKTQEWVVANEWTRYSFSVELKKSTILSPIIIPRARAIDEPRGHIWIDGLQVEEGDHLSEFVSPAIESFFMTSSPDNFLSIEDLVSARMRIFSAKPHTSAKMQITVKNFFGEIPYQDTFDFKTDKDGHCEILLPFDKRFSEGIYVVKAKYSLSEGEEISDFFRFAIMPFIKTQPSKLKAFFSNCYYGDFKRDVYPGLERYLERCSRIGTFGITHAGFVSENLKNLYLKYDMDIIDQFLSACLRDSTGKTIIMKNGQKGFAIFSDAPYRAGAELLVKDFRAEGDESLNDPYIQKFKDAVIKFVKEYPWMSRLSFGGEDEAKWPEWLAKDIESYAKINIAFYEAVKSVNPNVAVFNAPPCNINPEGGIKAIENLLAQLNGRIKFDALSCHIYLPEEPYALEANIEMLLTMAEKYGYKDTPVFFPEGMHYGPYKIPQYGIISAAWGPPQTWYYGTLSYDMGWTEKLAAAYCARSWLIIMKHMDRVISTTSSAINMISNYHLDSKLTPRAYQKMPNTLCKLLGNSRFVNDLSFSPETKCLIFEDADSCPIAVVWSELTKVDQGLEEYPWASARFGAYTPNIFDLMGAERTAKKEPNGTIRFPLSPFPFFIKGEKGSLVAFSTIMSDAKIESHGIIPFKLLTKLISPESFELTVANMISRKVEGSLLAFDSKQEITLRPSEKISFSVKLPTPLSTSEIKNITIPVTLSEKGNDEAQKKDIDLNGFLCKYSKTAIKIDGNIDDWADVQAIPFRNRYFMKPEAAISVKDEDLSGYFKTTWDKDFLYMTVVIKDKMYFHEEYEKTAQRYDNDSLQIYIDSCADARDKNRSGYDSNDYDYAVFPNKDGNKSVVFRYKSPDRQLTLGIEAPPDLTVEPNTPSAFKKTADAYVYELKIPAKYLLPAKLEKNYSVGFSLFVNDRDEKSGVKQALTLTPQGTSGYNKPNLYPIMLLVE